MPANLFVSSIINSCKMKFILILLLCVIQLEAVGQKTTFDTDKYTLWSPYFKLSWSHYEGKPASRSTRDARTAIKIMAKPHLIKEQPHYRVYALFNKKKSWYRVKSPTLLAHEQLHFDIAELTARQVRSKVADLQKFGVKDIKIYNREINKILTQSNLLDKNYDIETLHGILDDKQLEWENNIQEEIINLDKYQ